MPNARSALYDDKSMISAVRTPCQSGVLLGSEILSFKPIYNVVKSLAPFQTLVQAILRMFDILLRPLKDHLFNPLLSLIPRSVHPHQLTFLALLCGLLSCLLSIFGFTTLSILFWLFNRSLDCLDGALARHRSLQSELGGFLDLLGDFIVYALIPVCAVGRNYFARGAVCEQAVRDGLVVALLEASFYLNNFVLFYIAALVEKSKASDEGAQGLRRHKDEITSLAMRPALIEGFESGVFFTLMLGFPEYVGVLSAVMLVGVVVGTGQRTRWLVASLSREKMN